MTTRLLSFALLLLTLFMSSACDKHAEDKAAIRACVEELGRAYDRRDGKRAAELVTQESLDHYGRLLKVALDGKRAEVDSLEPFDKAEVFIIRMKGTRKEMRGLTGRGYQAWTTKQAWWESPDSSSWNEWVTRLNVDASGESAWAYIHDGEKTTGHKVRFQKASGEWKVDELSFRAYTSWTMKEEARQRSVTIDHIVEEVVEYLTDERMPQRVWETMK